MNVAPGAWRYALPPLLAAPFALAISVGAGALALAAGVGVLAFFRDPDRSPPPAGVVAPADGRVSVLRPEGDRVRLGVFMNVWNVHVTRAPFAGAVTEVEHTPGAHRPAFSKESDRNERVHVRFEGGTLEGGPADPDGDSTGDADPTGPDPAGAGADGASDATEPGDPGGPEVTLVAGAFARRIHPYVEAGDDLGRGERIGHIAFGSRVDVLFPPSVDREDVRVEVGDSVTAGETVILESSDADGPAWLEDPVDAEAEDSPGPAPDREGGVDPGDDTDRNGGEGAWS